MIEVPAYSPKKVRDAYRRKGVQLAATCRKGTSFDKKVIGYSREDFQVMNDKQLIAKLLKEAPANHTGAKYALFGTNCLWWTTDYEDANHSAPIPVCPHCEGPLKSAPLDEFLKNAYERKQQHQDAPSIAQMLKALHGKYPTCRTRWTRYDIRIQE